MIQFKIVDFFLGLKNNELVKRDFLEFINSKTLFSYLALLLVLHILQE